jgi:predicted nucleotidyltransferase
MAYTSELLSRHRSDIVATAARHGARSVRVFGSVARGDAVESSDVDFLVDMDEEATLFDRAALIVELRQLLGCDVDVVTQKALKPRVRERVLAEAVPL